MFTSPQECFSFPQGFVYASPVMPFKLFLGMLFTFPQVCCLAFPRDVIYLSPGILFTFPGMLFAFSPGKLFTFQGCHLPFPRVNPKQALLVY